MKASGLRAIFLGIVIFLVGSIINFAISSVVSLYISKQSITQTTLNQVATIPLTLLIGLIMTSSPITYLFNFIGGFVVGKVTKSQGLKYGLLTGLIWSIIKIIYLTAINLRLLQLSYLLPAYLLSRIPDAITVIFLTAFGGYLGVKLSKNKDQIAKQPLQV